MGEDNKIDITTILYNSLNELRSDVHGLSPLKNSILAIEKDMSDISNNIQNIRDRVNVLEVNNARLEEKIPQKHSWFQYASGLASVVAICVAVGVPIFVR